MIISLIIIGAVLSYLLGSVPTSVWYGKAQFGIDIREFGSGNAGATNTFRVLGKKAGSLVMAVDVFKGFAATSLTYFLQDLSTVELTQNQLILTQLLFGVCAVLGHIFPLYAKFKGGKGVATLLGMVLAINLEASLACIAVFLIVFLTTKYVSLGSMIAALAFPLALSIPFFNAEEAPNTLLIIFGFVLFSVVVLTHRKNINRLLKGEENRANINIGKKRQE